MESSDALNTEQPAQSNTQEAPRKKIITYVRESKKDGSVNTFDAQITAIHSFMERNELKQYQEIPFKEGKSAFREGRPRFQEMMELLKADMRKNPENREYIGVIFFDVSRMARNSADFVKIEGLIAEGYKIYSVSENIIDSPAGKYFFRMIQMESIYYSDRQSSKSQRYNLTILCNNPYTHTGGSGITYGYNKGGTKPPIISIHPFNSMIVREIFKLAKAGKTGKETEQLLLDSFEKQKDDYNRKLGIGKTSGKSYQETDKEDEEIDLERFIAMEEGEEGTLNKDSIPASLPNEKQISDILVGKGRIQYNGFRNYQFKVVFEEDIPLFTSIIQGRESGGKTSFIFPKDQVLRKGEQTLVLDVRERLTIIENDLFQSVSTRFKRETDETKRHIQVYKGLLHCTCGRHIVGALAAGNRMYYGCKIMEERKRKPTVSGNECRWSKKLTEEDVDTRFSEAILSKIYTGYCMYDKGGLGEGLYSKRINDATNRLRSENAALTILKKKLTDGEENEILLLKIKKKEDAIRKYESSKVELKAKAADEERFIFEKIANYLYEPKDIKQAIAQLVLKNMVMEETDDLYRNKKDTRNAGLPVKELTSFEINPYFNMLYVLGDLHSKEVG